MRGGTSNRTGPHGWSWQMRNTRPVGPLDASDGYRLFAYSHLASLAGTPSDMGLVLYPVPPEVRPGSNNGSGSLIASSPLWLVSVPFPARADVRSQATWNQYISQGHLLFALSPPSWLSHLIRCDTKPTVGNGCRARLAAVSFLQSRRLAVASVGSGHRSDPAAPRTGSPRPTLVSARLPLWRHRSS
jgi:hypothetical protein